MNTTTKPGVLAFLDAEIASSRALSADAYHAERVPKLEEVRATVERLAGAAERIDAAIMAWRMSGKPDLGELNAAHGELIDTLAALRGDA